MGSYSKYLVAVNQDKFKALVNKFPTGLSFKGASSLAAGMIDKGGIFDKSLQVNLHFDINIFLFSQLPKQAYSLFRCICSVIDQRRLQQLRKLEKVSSGTCARNLHSPYIRCTCQASRFACAGTRLSA